MKNFLIRVSKLIVLSFVSGVVFTFGQWWVFELNRKNMTHKQLMERRNQRLREIRERRAEQFGFDHPSNTPHSN